METAIVAESLTKYYGDTPGIVDLDLEVGTGEIFGFLGVNGAGKTTTIRTFLDLLHPTSGSASILGMDSHRDAVRVHPKVGYIPGDVAMYPDMTGRELCRYFAHLRALDTSAEVERLADRLDLDLDRRIGAYSSGNRQKVAIVQAFMHRPELLILDEPSTGLDPLMQQEFYAMVREARDEGRTVFLSSHILPEVERVADRVGVVRASRLVAVETVEGLRARARRHIQIVFTSPVDPAAFRSVPGVQEVRPSHDGRGVDLVVAGSLEQVMAVAARSGVENVISHEGDLEDAFLALYDDHGA